MAMLDTMKRQQMKDGPDDYIFLRVTDRQLDTRSHVGHGSPVKPTGLIASAFRPSDDATTFGFLIPSNFMAVSSLRKAAEILTEVNKDTELATECSALADEVEEAIKKYAVVNHPEYGDIYAFEVDGFGSHLLMDDANVPSLLAMPYLGDVSKDDPVYRNTRRFVLSDSNPWFWMGKKLLLPVDAVIASSFPNPIDAKIEVSECDIQTIPADKMGLDIGSKSRELFANEVKNAKTVIWNGPMGVFENPILANGTIAVAKAMAEADGATTIIGGGDSAAAVAQLGFADKMSHISTGGGASLELFEGKVLPGIACLNEK